MTNKEAIAILTHNWKYRELIDNSYQYEALDLAIKALEERLQGEWEVRVNNLNKSRTIHCSICDYHFEAWQDRPNFCPNCGADMSKEAKE